jgi:hypothetical protein
MYGSTTDTQDMAIVIETPKKRLKLLEAIPDGVNMFNLNNRLKYYHENSKVGIRRLEWASRTPEMNTILFAFVEEVLGRPYKQLANIMEFVRALRQANQTENLQSIFCSELVAAAYKRIGLLSEDVSLHCCGVKDN